MSNFFAQTEALMHGKTGNSSRAEFDKQGIRQRGSFIAIKVLRVINRQILFLLKKLTLMLVLWLHSYEHKIFVQGVIWNIF
jgi:glucose-6-phosphate isomerase